MVVFTTLVMRGDRVAISVKGTLRDGIRRSALTYWKALCRVAPCHLFTARERIGVPVPGERASCSKAAPEPPSELREWRKKEESEVGGGLHQ
ncbi:MAG: hypothetical protein A3C81_03040 [Candidatus Yanofskybacteria bacterium RIFCSPHIGHO2_02_FULL_46_19]|uniref:Uncharacterized protein n=1 Tax=Candidatus Yanofskybacteria bacterium RIFCSPHIGHO2_02_FULL_46_19 TaxID=1802684 RepID=A0A1F8FSL3_9BACT|nr:MAG: hypothetical protein A3C81_03040 [Candidatus Yanofskybacteria bacterium RIFCSPHIGHO2_02_FULL_46_19]